METDFLHPNDFSESELFAIMDSADALRVRWIANEMPRNLCNKNVALIWDAGGFRNRVAFELGIAAMGGKAVQIPGKLDVREPIEDVVRHLATDRAENTRAWAPCERLGSRLSPTGS